MCACVSFEMNISFWNWICQFNVALCFLSSSIRQTLCRHQKPRTGCHLRRFHWQHSTSNWRRSSSRKPHCCVCSFFSLFRKSVSNVCCCGHCASFGLNNQLTQPDEVAHMLVPPPPPLFRHSVYNREDTAPVRPTFTQMGGEFWAPTPTVVSNPFNPTFRPMVSV